MLDLTWTVTVKGIRMLYSWSNYSLLVRVFIGRVFWRYWVGAHPVTSNMSLSWKASQIVTSRYLRHGWFSPLGSLAQSSPMITCLFCCPRQKPISLDVLMFVSRMHGILNLYPCAVLALRSLKDVKLGRSCWKFERRQLLSMSRGRRNTAIDLLFGSSRLAILMISYFSKTPLKPARVVIMKSHL